MDANNFTNAFVTFTFPPPTATTEGDFNVKSFVQRLSKAQQTTFAAHNRNIGCLQLTRHGA
jgi:hypothetical protein